MVGMFLHRKDTKKDSEQAEISIENEKRSGEFAHTELVPRKSSEDNVW